MNPQPRRENYRSNLDYSLALSNWRLLNGRPFGDPLGSGTGDLTASITAFDEEEGAVEVEVNEEALASLMKKRHLNRDERRALHQPKTDWAEGNRGEVCRSACELDVSDLLANTT